MSVPVAVLEIDFHVEGLKPTGMPANMSFSGTGLIGFVDESIGSSDTDLEIACAIDVSEIQAIVMIADQDLTLEFNDGTTPDFTISLKANKPFIEWLDEYHTSKLTDDTTAVFVTNGSGEAATLSVFGLIDATPD